MRSVNRVLAVLAFLPLVYCTYTHHGKLSNLTAIDYFSFWAVPHIVFTYPVNNFYETKDQNYMYQILKDMASLPESSFKQQLATKGLSMFHYDTLYATASPVLYTVIGLLSSGAYDSDQHIFLVVCFVSFIISILLLCNLFRIPTFVAMMMLMFFLFYFSPLQSDISVGNVNQIQLLMLSCFMYLMARSRNVLAGLVLGVAFMFKPNIFIVFPLLVILMTIDREDNYYKVLIGSAVGCVLSFIISSAYFGRVDVWYYFIQSLTKTLSAGTPLYQGNIGLSSLIYSVVKIDISRITLLILVVIYAIILYLSKSVQTKHVIINNNYIKQKYDAFAIVAIGSSVMLLTINLVWYHYYIFILPIMIFLIRPDERNGYCNIYRIIVCVIVIICMFSFTTFVEFRYIFRPDVISILVNLSTIIVTLITLCEVYNYRKFIHKRVAAM